MVLTFSSLDILKETMASGVAHFLLLKLDAILT